VFIFGGILKRVVIFDGFIVIIVQVGISTEYIMIEAMGNGLVC